MDGRGVYGTGDGGSMYRDVVLRMVGGVDDGLQAQQAQSASCPCLLLR